MRKATINVYQFDELSEEAQFKAMCDHAEFNLHISHNLFKDDGSVKDGFEDYYVVKAIQENEKLLTPWFTVETIIHDYREELINEIKLNGYEFDEHGKFWYDD